MKKRKTRDLLIRNVPFELCLLLEKSALEHHRSKTQEAIVALSHGLKVASYQLQKPAPFKWKQKITNSLIQEAIEEGRE